MRMFKKSSVLVVLFLAIAAMGKAQVVQDFESGSASTQTLLGWEFNNIQFKSATNYLIYGKYSGFSQVSGSAPWCWLISPWVKVGAGSITIAMKVDDTKKTPRVYTLSAYSYDATKTDGKGPLLKVDSVALTSSTNNTIQTVTFKVPASYVGKLYRFKFSFEGMTGAAKASMDAYSIPGENYSDPTRNYLPKPEVVDTDKDGVEDSKDLYPKDPYRAYNNYYPTQAGYGSLVFEDSWPKKGDYDLNDVVVDYNINKVTNASNEVVEIKAQFVMRASGALFKNGFGFQLDGITPDKFTSVTGTRRSAGSYVIDGVNGLEQGQDFASCIVFDNFFNEMPYPGVGTGVNTDESAPAVPNDTLNVTLTLLNNGVAPSGGKLKLTDLASDLFNFYIIANQQRGTEVHLPGRVPTKLANRSLFNTADDASAIKYYTTSSNLPWALNIIQPMDYLVEKSEVVEGYLHFLDWVKSAGSQYTDWFANKTGYRNQNKIYKKSNK